MSQERLGATSAAEAVALSMRPRPKVWQIAANFCIQKPLGGFGAIVTAILIVVAVFATQIAPYDPLRAYTSLVFSPPGASDETEDPPVKLWLGGDRLGRDVLSRLLYGARVSLYVAVASVLAGVTAGALIGITTAYFGGAIDLVGQRIIDALMAIPGLVIALVLLSVLGSANAGGGFMGLAGLEKVVLAISVGFIPGTARTIRSQALRIKEADFVLAARAVGARDWRIILRHIAPNCFATYIILFTISMGWAVITEATLSFLGLGIPPDFPSWGGMLTGATQTYTSVAPWLGVFPGVAIVTVVLAWNFLGDSLRDVLDPRMRGMV